MTDVQAAAGVLVDRSNAGPHLLIGFQYVSRPVLIGNRQLGELVKMHNPNVKIVVYPGAGHAFFADYRPSFNAAAASDGWKRCTDWFAKYLKA